MKSRIISICLAKGGVGKSVSAVNLGAAIANTGKKTLLVDSDPQRGNMTLKLGLKPDEIKYTLSNAILSFLDEGDTSNTEKCIVNISKNIDLIPANPKLTVIQNRLIAEKSSDGLFEDENDISSEYVMKTILTPLMDRYEVIIIDTSPSISMLAINALVASDSVVIPMEAHYESYEALIQTLDVINRIKSKFNPHLEIDGILVTKYQSRTTLCRNIKDMVESKYGQTLHLFPEPVPYSIKAAEQAAYGISIFEHDPSNSVATAYNLAALEVLAHG